MRVLLLNPPGKDRYMRDNYCSTTTKANYYWHPIDLLFQSGIIAKEHEIEIIDANVNNLSVEDTMLSIARFKPDIIYSLASIISLQEDIDFLRQCKEKFSCKIIVSGDIFYFNPKEMIKLDFIDAILMDFTTPAILDYLKGSAQVRDMVYKRDGKIIIGERSLERSFSYPIPKHLSFQLDRYRMPFMRYSPFVCVATSYGCPFRCSFCPLSEIRFKERDIDNLFEELDFLHENGFREIVFRDPTFAANMKRTKEICRRMVEKGYRFSWLCDSRIDCADEELIALMKKAGCHTVMFGVESGNDEILKRRMKNIDREKIRKIFILCNKLGIAVLAHFIIGFPDDTEDTVNDTIRFALSLKYNYLSLNMYTPRYGTPLRSEVLNEISNDKSGFDSSKCKKSYCRISAETLKKYKKQALIRFYLNPLRLTRILFSIRTPVQFRELVANGITVLSK